MVDITTLNLKNYGSFQSKEGPEDGLHVRAFDLGSGVGGWGGGGGGLLIDPTITPALIIGCWPNGSQGPGLLLARPSPRVVSVFCLGLNT